MQSGPYTRSFAARDGFEADAIVLEWGIAGLRPANTQIRVPFLRTPTISRHVRKLFNQMHGSDARRKTSHMTVCLDPPRPKHV